MAGAHLVGVDGEWRSGAEVVQRWAKGNRGEGCRDWSCQKGFRQLACHMICPERRATSVAKVQAEGEEEVIWRGVGKEEVKKAAPALGQLFRLEHY